MRSVTLPNGQAVPALGLGTWRMGEDARAFETEVAALKAGLDRGLTLVDTAEMYGEGGAEEVVGAALAGRRDEAFVVSKVYPHNASREGVVAACERSLGRLKTDAIDLYLLHWPGSVPLEETIAGFERLKSDGKIRQWGVSNFDSQGMAAVLALCGEGACATDQVLYHPDARGIEWDLLPDLQDRGIPIMAYSPLGEGLVLDNPALARVGAKHGVGAAAACLAWVMRHPGMIAIPKAANLAHLQENVAATEVILDADDLAAIDAAFAPPSGPTPLLIT